MATEIPTAANFFDQTMTWRVQPNAEDAAKEENVLKTEVKTYKPKTRDASPLDAYTKIELGEKEWVKSGKLDPEQRSLAQRVRMLNFGKEQTQRAEEMREGMVSGIIDFGPADVLVLNPFIQVEGISTWKLLTHTARHELDRKITSILSATGIIAERLKLVFWDPGREIASAVYPFTTLKSHRNEKAPASPKI